MNRRNELMKCEIIFIHDSEELTVKDFLAGVMSREQNESKFDYMVYFFADAVDQHDELMQQEITRWFKGHRTLSPLDASMICEAMQHCKMTDNEIYWSSVGVMSKASGRLARASA